ncbi:hypothetical protein ACP275_11G027400 [Erythranthe tilingii]
MLSSLTLPIVYGSALLPSRQSHSSNFNSPAGFKRRLQREQESRLFPRRTRNQEIRVLANPNASSPSSEKRKAKKEVVMVDPVEAKRLAAKQMELIKAKEKFIKRRQIEAINGAWAMIGLTAGLVIEGQTGDSILAQLAGYGAAFLGFFVR